MSTEREPLLKGVERALAFKRDTIQGTFLGVTPKIQGIQSSQILKYFMLGRMAHSCNPRTQKLGQENQELEASLGYRRDPVSKGPK